MYDWEPSDNVLRTWIRLRQTCQALERLMERELDKHDASLAQLDVLDLIDASKVPLTLGQIASLIFRQPHSASALLNRMRQSGLVTKRRSKKDERVVTVKMTREGEQLFRQASRSALRQAREPLSTALSEAEIEELDRLAKKVRDKALEQLGVTARPLPDTIDLQGRRSTPL
jgi:DNA-binding MarR family transcriptional regulator